MVSAEKYVLGKKTEKVRRKKMADSLHIKKDYAKERKRCWNQDSQDTRDKIDENGLNQPVVNNQSKNNKKELLDKIKTTTNMENKHTEKKQEMKSLYCCAEDLKNRVRLACFENAIYAFNGAVYEKLDTNKLVTLYRDKVDRELHGVKTMASIEGLYKFLLTDSEIQKEIDYTAVNNLVVLQNGIFDVRKQELSSHNSKQMFVYMINAKYTDNNNTPIFDTFLEQVTNGNTILIERMWHLIAYLCMHSVSAKAFFVLGTEPNSGKTVFGKFIEGLFEKSYVSSISLNDMNKEFSLAQIVGKAVNISMDLPSSKLNPAAISKLKMLTGDDLITINEKYVPQYRYYNRAKFLFASNHPISIAEPDEAFWNRVVYLPFNNSISAENQDKQLLEKLLSEKDRVISKALRKAKKFIENNYVFQTTQEIEDTIASWKGEKNYSIENFLRDCCDINSSYEGEWTADLYAAYEQYCVEFNKEVVSKEFFRKFLDGQQQLKCAKFRKEKFPGNPRHGYRGIMLLTR